VQLSEPVQGQCSYRISGVSLFVSTGMFAYLKPPSFSSPSLDLVVAVVYSVEPPPVKHLIYSMKNQELKDSIWELAQWVLCHQK